MSIIIDFCKRQVGKPWISMVDNNTWEPGAAGVGPTIWKEVI